MYVFFVSDHRGWFTKVAARNLASVVFCLIVITLLYKFQIGNVMTAWLGKCSYEIYLIHFYVIEILQKYMKNNILFSVNVIFITLAAAYAAYSGRRLMETRLERNRHLHDLIQKQ